MSEQISVLQFPLNTSEIAKEINEDKKILAKKRNSELLIRNHRMLVIKIASQYINRHYDYMDVVQEGNMGLIHAANKFDPKHNVQFSTYAMWWVRHFIQNYMNKNHSLIRLPHRKTKALKIMYLHVDNDKTPNYDTISKKSGLTIEEVKALFALPQVISQSNDEFDIVSYYPDTQYGGERQFFYKEMRKLQNMLIASLEPELQSIIHLRFPADGSKPVSIADIAEKKNCDVKYVRLALRRAYHKMRLLAAKWGHESGLYA